MTSVGFALQPDEAFLELCAPVFAEAEHLELAPETAWGPSLEPNLYAARFLAIAARHRLPFVAHGVGLSMATADRADAPRRARHLAALARDQRRFRFLWYTDHLGASALAGRALTLPLPTAMSAYAVRTLRGRLRAMRRVVADVGLENNVAYFVLGSPLDEPAFLMDALSEPGSHLLLDLHNLHTMAENHGFDPLEYLASIDLDRVIELHLSGGAMSDPAWLPGGRRLRLDAHDGAVPEAVWALYAHVAPRCSRLRGVTLERMEGTVRADDAALLVEELRRAKAGLRGPKLEARRPSPARARLASSAAEHRALEALLARAMTAGDPAASLRAGAAAFDGPLRAQLLAASADGARLSALLVAQLRFERLLRGSPAADRAFATDPAAFSARFGAYHHEVPPRAFSPREERALFEAWERAGAEVSSPACEASSPC